MDEIIQRENGRTGQESVRVLTNPILAINAEFEKAKLAPERAGLLNFNTANNWIEDGLKTPNPKMYFHNLIAQNEITVLFASSNVGKSILAVQIAEDVAREEKVMYVDLELSTKQFQMRYSDPETHERHIFPDNFYRAEIAVDRITEGNLDQGILASIEMAIEKGYRFFIIDNISFICSDTEKGASAGSFMIRLKQLRAEYSLTMLVIAHTPKRRGYEPITQNDLAGSAVLMNLFDAGFAIARSAKDPDMRYLKQVKVRTGKFQYDYDNVMNLKLVNDHGYVRFEIDGFSKECEHLKTRDDADNETAMEALRLKNEGKSVREIAGELGIPPTSTYRLLKKAEALADVPSVPPVPSVPGVEQAEQLEQCGMLPFNDQED